MSQARGRASRSLMWSVLETFGATGFSVLAMILLARVLTVEQLSIGALAVLIIQLVSLPFEIMFHDALVQRPDVSESEISSAFVCTGIAALVAAVLLFVLAPAIGRRYGSADLELFIRAGVFSIPLAGLSSVISATLRRKLAFAPLARRTIVGRLLGVCAGVITAFVGGGGWSLVVMHVGSITIATAVLLSDRRYLPKFYFSRSAAFGMLKFALPNMLAQLMITGNSRLFLAAFAVTTDAATFGRFSLAFRLVEELRNTLSAAASQLALPIFSRLVNDKPGFLRIYKETTAYTVILLLPLYAGLSVLAPDMVVFVFGEKWIGTENIIRILCFSSVIMVARQYSGVALNALGFPGANIKINGSGFFSSLLPFAFFTSTTGILAAIVWCARAVVMLLISVFSLKKYASISMRDQLKPMLSAVLASCFMAVVLLFLISPLVREYHVAIRLLISILAGAIIYALLVLLMDRAVVIKLRDFLFGAIRAKA